MKKIVITGSESFIGKELISQLKNSDCKIIGFDALSPSNPTYEFHQTDIRSPNISELIPENTDAIIHLAALSRDPDCKNKALECFDVNVMGTLNLMKSSHEKNVKQFIFASSEWVYDKFVNSEEKNEESQINIANHTSEYALSKLVTESNLRQQFQHGFSDVTILRFGIIYGPRKSNWSAVESIFHQVKNQNKVTVGSLNTGRRFVHVSDIAGGIIASLGLKGFNIINLTGNNIMTLKDIIKTSQEILSKTVEVQENNPDQISIRNPSNLKAKKMINWEPKIDLKSGLKSLIPYV
ncbi:UDP-glucose 4-epimerase protein [Marine Group I thaumarchaeote SCGC AAA799-B03]|uniref:UDP-glucose 4-epimerase protein n=1 Tax=Marine Group I thaumarchaeote SCGC AAA799-B03 TaxID=1502289 RepID=A0A087S8T9_9ARCH|nr:UDP-glucose 4-epimerase protein [Marine Group I thaumarchaeote SCGC AAA799-B03]